MSRPKLTPEQRRQVVAMYDEGDKIADIAALFGVTGPAVAYLAAKYTTLRRDAPIPHGTRRGYQRHRALGGIPCGPCRQANSDHGREYFRARKAATT